MLLKTQIEALIKTQIHDFIFLHLLKFILSKYTLTSKTYSDCKILNFPEIRNITSQQNLLVIHKNHGFLKII